MSDPSDGPAENPESGRAEPQRETSSRFFRRRASLQSAKQALQPDPPPPPPPRSRRRREGTLSAMSGFLSFLLIFAVAGLFGVIAALHKLREPGPLAAEKIVYIPPRSDVLEILGQLEREGVIDNPTLMNIALHVEGTHAKLKPGEYLFKQNASMREVMEALVAGRQILHGVTIPEGLTTEQILTRLRDNDVLAGDLPEAPQEGALLPETYKVVRNYSRAKLIAKMQEDQRKLLDRVWARRAHDLPIRTPYELVTLASIVEKETGRADERPRVAAVFANRLRKGMRLQSDPTIVYGLVGGKATLGRGILKSEVEKWTPYNTYVIDGLPPGPIANPGKAALEAAANPAQTRELYFVADGAGGHAFAETLEQHRRNVQRWRQIEKEQQQKEKSLGVDRLEPGATVGPPPARPPRERRGEAGPLGRLVATDEPREDYPFGLALSADQGSLKRLGAYLPDIPTELSGDNEGSLRLASERAAARREATPVFTTAFAQSARADAHSGGAMLLLAEPSAAEPEDAVALVEDDEPFDPGGSYPMPSRLQEEQSARAATLESAAQPLSFAETRGSALSRPGRPRAFDASEGTALDPLRDKNWDLNSAKTVPNVATFK